ncbi:hypothetical protein SPHINGOT1_270114 [Sphingomonas sp. T1]|nr:hypothetical protein SPHINGOT1_270114 [Sphingomonas sp. T1]
MYVRRKQHLVDRVSQTNLDENSGSVTFYA